MKATVSCHCGAVKLSVTLAQPLSDAKRCDCSLCARRGAGMVTAKAEDLEVVQGADHLTLYSFNTHVAQHYFCKTCGIYTHHQRRSNPNEFGVNAANIEGVRIRDFEPIAWMDGVNHPRDR